MPKGFKNVRFPGSDSNTYRLDDNCYYCTVAALLGKTVCEPSTDPQSVYRAIRSFPEGESVGLAYVRSDGSGHMIVATRDEGYVNGFVNEGLKLVDYQQSPPKVTGFPPESQITQYLVFYRS